MSEDITSRVYRCEHCQSVVIDEDIAKGGCVCGSRRLTIATSVTDDEVTELEGRGYTFDKRNWIDKETAESERRVE